MSRMSMFLYAVQRKSCNFTWEITNRVYQQAWQDLNENDDDDSDTKRRTIFDKTAHLTRLVRWTTTNLFMTETQESQDYFRYYGSVWGSYKHIVFVLFCILFSL